MSNHLMNTYARLPVSFVKGQGALLHDSEGKNYIDGISGIAVCSLGHAHPAISDAICAQSQTLLHTSNLYQIDKQQQLADKLCELSGMEQAFFCNSVRPTKPQLRLRASMPIKKALVTPRLS
ncbi:hypothetical protein THIOSC13_1600002 [uncultured Thiomicrorhabdus sp.]